MMWGFPLEGALPASGSWLGAAFPAAALASPRPLCLIYLKLFNQNLCLRTLVSMAQLPGFFFLTILCPQHGMDLIAKGWKRDCKGILITSDCCILQPCSVSCSTTALCRAHLDQLRHIGCVWADHRGKQQYIGPDVIGAVSFLSTLTLWQQILPH